MALAIATGVIVPSTCVVRRNDAFIAAVSRLGHLTNWELNDRRRMLQEWSLRPMLDLMNRLGNPHRDIRIVHVAGTKGKGSVCSLIEQGLLSAGFKAARYASPHVECITERISIAGASISKADFGEILENVLNVRELAAREQTAAKDSTTFDLLTACAFQYFRRCDVEWAVVECGLGGRLDSTNVSDGEVAVITNIDLEHTEVLGRTKSAIAREKAGIIKPGAVVVTGVAPETEAGAVILKASRQNGCSVLTVDQNGTIESANTRLAAAAMDEVFRLSAASCRSRDLIIPELVSRSRLPGRQERFSIMSVFGFDVPVVLDGAHVPSSLTRVLDDITGSFVDRPCTVLMGLGADKDAAGMVTRLQGRAKQLVTTQVSNAAFDRFKLKELAEEAGIRACTAPSASDGLRLAAEIAGARGWILATGSLHLAGAVRPHLKPAC